MVIASEDAFIRRSISDFLPERHTLRHRWLRSRNAAASRFEAMYAG
jgi:hypothetical protein